MADYFRGLVSSDEEETSTSNICDSIVGAAMQMAQLKELQNAMQRVLGGRPCRRMSPELCLCSPLKRHQHKCKCKCKEGRRKAVGHLAYRMFRMFKQPCNCSDPACLYAHEGDATPILSPSYEGIVGFVHSVTAASLNPDNACVLDDSTTIKAMNFFGIPRQCSVCGVVWTDPQAVSVAMATLGIAYLWSYAGRGSRFHISDLRMNYPALDLALTFL
eukprot:Sspe_Gene.112692::Locus_95888_Transcript_5_10_Confidence_0.200_Length_811::g.112692::m.112692